MTTTPNVGDKFTRTQTFTVTAVDVPNRRVTLQDDTGNTATKGFAVLDQLTFIAPPAVTFQPGQTVVRLVDGALFSLTDKGYFDHAAGVMVESVGVFTSTSFRLAVVS